MIIKEIHIDGFGIYNDFSIDNFRKGLNIILGKNEAGKTTLLRFLRYTLFGYPKLKEERMAPLRGGAHGGKIMGILSSGNEITVDRKGDRSFTLFFSDREYSNEGELLQLLGNASSSLYNNVYAFTLDELVSLGSLTDSGVEDKIFSVGMGLGDISLAEIESDIRNRINKIYKGTARNKVIPDILKEIGERKSEIATLRGLLPKHRELSGELERLAGETAGLEKLAREKSIEKIRLDNYLKCYDSFVRITTTDKELNELPALRDYPDEGPQKMELLEGKREDLQERLQEINNGSAGEKGIGEMKDLAGSIFYNRDILDEAGRVEYLRTNLSGYLNTLRDYNQDELERKKLAGQVKEALAGINPVWKEDDLLRLRGTEIHKAAIRSFRQELEALREKKIAAEAHAYTLSSRETGLNTVNTAIIVSLVFLISSVPAFYYSLPVLGGALVLAGILVFAGRKFMIKESSGTLIDNKIEELKNQEARVMEKYRSYLEDKLDLPGSVPIDAVDRVLDEADKTVDKISQIRITEAKQQEQRKPLIHEFESVARSLIPVISEDDRVDNIEILVARIISEFNLSAEKQQEKEGYENELQRKLRERENLEKKLEETTGEIRALLDGIGAADPGDFAAEYRQNNRVKHLEDERNNSVQTIESILGLGKSDDVISYFNVHQKEQVESEIEELKAVTEEMNERVKEQRSKMGELRNEIKRVEEGSDMAASMTGLETAKHKLHTAVTDWLSGRMALELLIEVRSEYEREKQPAVINNAARFFSAVTAGRYNRLHVSMGDRDVQVYDDKGVFKTTHQLSRGAREQLLMSLRLGFIEEYEKQAEPLPLVADEVLVNFDPDRARRMADVLYEFSIDRQMLMFSCHPEILDLFDGKDVNLIKL